jgi:tRNA threonylcarbamoyladenosine biosynthesis protein TsaB
MRILGLDSATTACSAAVESDGRCIAHHLVEEARRHAEYLVPIIERVMKDAGASYETLDAVAASIGPGSFTGVRVGLATARALALAADRPLIGISSLAALAASAVEEEDGHILAVLDARRDQVYAQLFDAEGVPVGEAHATEAAGLAALLPTSAGKLVVVGSGRPLVEAPLRAAGFEVRLSNAPPHADAKFVAACARPLVAEVRGKGWRASLSPQPLYLRASGAERQSGRGL